MNMLGMDCRIVHNEYHSWNLVRLDDGVLRAEQAAVTAQVGVGDVGGGADFVLATHPVAVLPIPSPGWTCPPRGSS